jgi:hypothetical protein
LAGTFGERKCLAKKTKQSIGNKNKTITTYNVALSVTKGFPRTNANRITSKVGTEPTFSITVGFIPHAIARSMTILSLQQNKAG